MTDPKTNSEVSPVKEINVASGAIPPQHSQLSEVVIHYRDAITSCWNSSIENIFDAARLCAEADEKLDDFVRSRDTLISLLPFSETVFSRLVSIAKDARFADPDIRKRLPPHWSLIDELRRLSVDQFNNALTQGKIGPELTRADILGFRGSSKAKVDTHADQIVVAIIYGTKNLPEQDIQDFIRQVNDLTIDHRIEHDWVWAEKESKKEATEIANRPRLARRKAKEFIRLAKANWKVFRTGKWPHSAEETEITKHSTIEELKVIMELIGYDDQFEQFLKKEEICG